jgi:DNA (cytosine-5)-methyltransferase 1
MAFIAESEFVQASSLNPVPRIKTRPVAVDLFAGAGGLSEGFSEAGFFVALAIENDNQAATTYAYNHCRWKSAYRPQLLNTDIAGLDFPSIAAHLKAGLGRPPDIVFGGPPCQGFSRSNMMTRNPSNPANNLARYFVKAVDCFQPKFAVIENVADLKLFDDGRFIEALRREFYSINYLTEYCILNAVDFGVPQRRRRIFFVAARSGIPIDFPEPTTAKRTQVTVWDAISDLPSLKNGNTTDVMAYRDKGPPTAYQAKMRSRMNSKIRNNLVSCNSELVIKRYAYIPQGGNWKNIPDELMANYEDKSRCHDWIYLRLREDQPSVAITHFRKSMLIHPRENRGLSVREAARIQSFPDHFVFCGSLGSQQQQVANAVPPLLAKAMANRLRQSLGF